MAEWVSRSKTAGQGRTRLKAAQKKESPRTEIVQRLGVVALEYQLAPAGLAWVAASPVVVVWPLVKQEAQTWAMMGMEAEEAGVAVELQGVAPVGMVGMTADMSEVVGEAMGLGVTGMVGRTEAVAKQGWVERSAG